MTTALWTAVGIAFALCVCTLAIGIWGIALSVKALREFDKKLRERAFDTKKDNNECVQ